MEKYKTKAMNYANRHAEDRCGIWMMLREAYIAGAREMLNDMYGAVLGSDNRNILVWIDGKRNELQTL